MTVSRVQRRQTNVTISDVATAVGVATSTVSRALSQPGRVGEATRQLIIEKANELGYHPNPRARSLTSGQTLTLALLVPDITNPFYFGLIRGIQAQSKARGYSQLLVDTEESAAVEEAYLSSLSKSVDGVILAASRLSDDALSTAQERIPLVTINRDVPSVPAVIIDTASAMSQILDHLVSLGHTSVAYLGGPLSSWSSDKRWRALQQAASVRHVEAKTAGPFSPTVQAGAAAADAAVQLGVTACIFFNDLLAIGALQRFAERKIRVPTDMSIVGCDDIFGASFCNPPLSTLTAPIEQAGRVATDILLTGIQERNSGSSLGGPGARHRETLPTYLTIRSSTGPAPRSGRSNGREYRA